MTDEKKVILLVVEGPSDETALGLLLDRHFRPQKIAFDIVHGDMTTSYGSEGNAQHENILTRLKDQVIEYVSSSAQAYDWEDLAKVVLITDTDGAYIPEEAVVFEEDEDLLYCNDCIKTNDVAKFVSRNRMKRRNTHKLCTKHELKHNDHDVTLEVYYFSRNLEHVLHDNDAELSQDEKKSLARDFRSRYKDNLSGFVEFMSNSDFSVDGTYEETWSFIRSGNNSLHRHTNMHLLLKDKNLLCPDALEDSCSSTEDTEGIQV